MFNRLGSLITIARLAIVFSLPLAPLVSISAVQSINGPHHQPTSPPAPARAYTPFGQHQDQCPAGGCEYRDNVLLVKLKDTPDTAFRSQLSEKERSQAQKTLIRNALQDLPIGRIDRVFQQTEPAAQNRTLQTPNGEWLTVPDLTLWHRIELDPNALDTNSPWLQQPKTSDGQTRMATQTIDLAAVIKDLQSRSDIDYAEPEYIYRLNAQPQYQPLNTPPVPGDFYSDPDIDQQWHFDAAAIPEAWDFLDQQGLPSGGSSDIIVAVIDTGVDYTHPDLINSMWVNPGEFNTSNNSDSDGNGYRDDIHGAKVISGSLSGNPMDDHGHGTHVAGIIAAQGNNAEGGVGVAPNVKIMAIKAAQYSGILNATDVARGIEYAMDNGADVINMSFGSYAQSQLIEDALANAYGTAILVAAAGNDGRANLSCDPLVYPNRANMYPAAYNWVIGVMAQNSTADANGDRLAGFSNFDCKTKDGSEYEVMAPGVGIYSTLPFDGYGAWSGTSMATPVVAGVAALARTYWSDKSQYSSRFIMGQVVSTGPLLQAHTHPLAGSTSWASLDAEKSLSTAPEPSLDYLAHWVFDGTDIDADNTANGRVESGETIELALTIRNHWGKADNVSVTLEAIAPGAVQPDPYVTMITDTVSYGAVSSFSEDDNGLIRDGDGVVIGAANPFKFSVADTAPNNHLITFKVTMTADNGFDANAASTTDIGGFYLMVQRGKMLPSVISADMTLTADDFWIVPGPVLIPSGVTVNVDPGAQIQWGGSLASGPYQETQVPYLQVEGSLLVNGTEAEPVELFPHPFSSSKAQIISTGTTELRYCLIEDPRLGIRHDQYGWNSHKPIDLIDHCRLTSSGFRGGLTVIADTTQHSYFKLHALQRENNSPTAIYDKRWPQIFYHQTLETSWVDINGGFGIDFLSNRNIQNTVITPHDPDGGSGFVSIYGRSDKKSVRADAQAHDSVRYNAFLNRDYEASLGGFKRYFADFQRDRYFGLVDNFWDVNSDALIDILISDSADDFNRGIIEYAPATTTPYSTTYPFVTDIDVQVDGVSTSEVGAQTMDVMVSFNRDMDTTVDPMVSFGPAMPYTDFIVPGAWQDARTWAGTFTTTPVTGDGYQYFRVINAVAADDAWLKTGNDYYRFRFEIITSGTEAMNMQASGGEGQIQLWWSQDDFETLAGYNIYRAPVGSNAFQRVNSTVIPQGLTNWSDTTVMPGQPYQYYFKVVKTDLSESEPSNTAQATALDTIAPVITHTPLVGTAAGQPVTLRANVTDNVSVSSVTLFFKPSAESPWEERTMNLINTRYSTTIEASAITAPGFSYYIEASDGVNSTQTAVAAAPHNVIVDDRPTVTGISPTSGPITGGTEVTITGSNFQSGASVLVGQSVCGNVVIDSSTALRCTTSAHFSEVVDVRVENPSAEPGILARAFTYVGGDASMSLPDAAAGSGGSLQVPLSIGNVSGLVSAQFKISYDPSVIEVRSINNGNLSPGWARAVNINQGNGTALVAMTTGGGSVTGDGSLVQMNVSIVGDPSDSTALTLSEVLLNDGAIPVTLDHGLITVDAVHEIKGNVRFWNGNRPMAGTALNLTGGQSNARGKLADAQSEGSYSLFLPSGNHVLTPTRTSADDAISSLDASMVLRHVVNLETLSGSAAKAADVNRSGSITAQDATQILQHVAGLASLPFNGAQSVWLFEPAQRTFSNLNSTQSAQNFTGILLGDPSGNWGATPPASIQARTLETGSISLKNAKGERGSTVTTELVLDSAVSGFVSIDFEISYDPLVVSVTSVTPTALLDGWSVSVNTDQSGVVRVAAAGAQSITGPGALFSLAFQMLGLEGAESDIRINKLQIDEGQVSPEIIHAKLTSGDPNSIFNDRFVD